MAVGPDSNEKAATDEEPAAEAPEVAADNCFCYVCHVNWKTEKFVEQHRLKGVGCCDCRGDSAAPMDA